MSDEPTSMPPQSGGKTRMERHKARRSERRIIIAAALVAVVVVAFAWLIFVLTSGNHDKATATTTSLSPNPSIYNSDMAANTADQQVVLVALTEKGWKVNQLNFSPKLIGHVADRGAASFSMKSLLAKEELVGFINSDQARAVSVRRNLKSQLANAGYGAKEYQRMLDGGHWIRVQFLVPFQWTGMTYYQNGHMVVSVTPRKVMAGDVGWFYVTSDGKLVPGRMVVRGDCSNPAPVPAPPPPNFVPPTKPQPTPTPTETKTPLQPKDPSAFPTEPSPPASAIPSPIGTLTPSPAPASPNPLPTDLPIHTPEPVPTPTQTAGPGNPSPNPTPSDGPTSSPGPGPTTTPTPGGPDLP